MIEIFIIIFIISLNATDGFDLHIERVKTQYLLSVGSSWENGSTGGNWSCRL